MAWMLQHGIRQPSKHLQACEAAFINSLLMLVMHLQRSLPTTTSADRSCGAHEGGGVHFNPQSRSRMLILMHELQFVILLSEHARAVLLARWKLTGTLHVVKVDRTLVEGRLT